MLYTHTHTHWTKMDFGVDDQNWDNNKRFLASKSFTLCNVCTLPHNVIQIDWFAIACRSNWRRLHELENRFSHADFHLQAQCTMHIETTSLWVCLSVRARSQCLLILVHLYMTHSSNECAAKYLTRWEMLKCESQWKLLWISNAIAKQR